MAHVVNYAAIRPDNLAIAEREAARIYEAIRVRILWVHGPEPRPDPCGFPLRVLLLSRDMELQLSRTQALGDTVFGFITRETGRAYILTDRIINWPGDTATTSGGCSARPSRTRWGICYCQPTATLTAASCKRTSESEPIAPGTSRPNKASPFVRGSPPQPHGMETSPVPRNG